MFGFVEVAAGDLGKVLEARHRKQIVSIRRLPQIHQVHQLVSVIPEITRTHLDATRGSTVRVTGDAKRTLPPDFQEDVFRTLIGRDVAADPERDDVRVLLRADVVLRDLGARQHQHAVQPPCALHLFGNLAEIFVERALQN
jgi:hypothetical protein